MKEEVKAALANLSVSQTPANTPEETIETIAHATSMAVWDVPLQVVLNSRFQVKVGVQCTAECKLSGSQVAIYDHTQALAGMGVLGDDVLPTTKALYWTQVQLQAPGTEGPFRWTARFSEQDGECICTEAAQEFTFGTVKPPECMVTVQVVDRESKNPIHHAHVIMHPYGGFTDEHGHVEIGVATGEYKLWIPRVAHYDTFRKMIQVEYDTAVEAELVPAPVPEP